MTLPRALLTTGPVHRLADFVQNYRRRAGPQQSSRGGDESAAVDLSDERQAGSTGQDHLPTVEVGGYRHHALGHANGPQRTAMGQTLGKDDVAVAFGEGRLALDVHADVA